jgi:hypothetical protein
MKREFKNHRTASGAADLAALPSRVPTSEEFFSFFSFSLPRDFLPGFVFGLRRGMMAGEQKGYNKADAECDSDNGDGMLLHGGAGEAFRIVLHPHALDLRIQFGAALVHFRDRGTL